MKVELRNIHKHFGSVHANNGINLTVESGTIMGILGENGAGKSTLMKILSGYIQPDSGEILLNDSPVVIHSPADAIRVGVGMLHQDPLDFPALKVLDDFILDEQKAWFPRRKKIEAEFRELQAQFGFSLDPNAYIDTLTVGERQQLELTRLIWRGIKVLILDEPTTGISAPQKIKLFAALKTLAAQGKTVIFVSHKLEDVAVLCDNAVVLRQGRLVGSRKPPLNEEDLVSLMFEKTLVPIGRQSHCLSEAALSVRGLAVEENWLKIKGVTFDLCKGEVIGVVGMEGSGQSALLRACAGLVPVTAGKIHVANRDLTHKTYHDFMQAGVTFLPASRMEEGLIPGMDLVAHFALAEPVHGFTVDTNNVTQLTQERIAEYAVKGRPGTLVEELSGGNQQRTLLALMRKPLNLLLMEHPTRGLDIDSSRYIWQKLKERCQQGTGILFISTDLDEVLQYADRVMVFFSGRVSQPLDAAKMDSDQLGMLISGADWDTFGCEESAK